ncbi:hypothetical protein GA830_03860 [Mesorhizobium sp. NBSH29]|uniref:hypothetical protein n=1 Tax=Mesorhizobium sp. NBSH29 TaxID=2654249 RepID=UPI00189666C2|nr:hypothetical protein [Mesorhizobium sp. NBSH29]QPC85964.1 hypothetical protein GA830_03860 [Mesorhizobium sp. NBSH29]
MLRELREEIRVNLKDRLRDIRHVVRAQRHDRSMAEKSGHAQFPLREIEDLFGHAASAVDDVISMAGTLVPADRAGSANGARGFGVYFPRASGEPVRQGERHFRRDMYAMAKALLSAAGVVDPRISEAAFAAVHAAIANRNGRLVGALRQAQGDSARLETVAALSAAMVIEAMSHRPVQIPMSEPAPEAPIAFDRSVEIACLSTLALACGTASLSSDAANDNVTMASLVVDARLERIQTALGSDDRQAQLSSIFASLLGHLR